MELVVKRFEVYIANLDPTRGSEIQKTRPCVIISPDEMNRFINTVIIAPMTTGSRAYPSRVPCFFQGKEGHIIIDQIRVVDKGRLGKMLGTLEEQTCNEIIKALQEMFSL